MLANIALPSFLPHSFATVVGIFVIAAIEGFFLMRLLDLDFSKAYASSLSANWRSTIVGIPVAWLLWVAGWVPVGYGLSLLDRELLELHPAVLPTLVKSAFVGGMMPDEWTLVGSAVAWLVMLVPFWFGSVWIERKTIAKRFPCKDPTLISKAVVRGNLASYCLFLVMGLLGLVIAIADLPSRKEYFEDRREQQEQYKAKSKGAAHLNAPPDRTEN